MGDHNLQTDLNAAILAVKQKCVDLDLRVQKEDESPSNRGRGYLGVRRYIYALTTKTHENALPPRRGRSLTRVYMEQKFYRSKSVPTPEQVERIEDCTQDYGPNNEERLEYTETIESPLVELIKEDQSHYEVVHQKLPTGHGEWDHELAVYEEDGTSGLIEDRTLTLRAGDHPYGLNQFGDVADKVSERIAEFFGQYSEVRKRELSMSVRPIYQANDGTKYTSYGVLSNDSKSKSKSMSSVHTGFGASGAITTRVEDIHRPRLERAPMSTSTSYLVQSQHEFDSRYGKYSSGYGRYGELPPIPHVQPAIIPPMRTSVTDLRSSTYTQEHQSHQSHQHQHKKVQEEHVYDVPIPKHREPLRAVTPTLPKVEHTVTDYKRKYDFKTTFPEPVELPEGYHSYYDPSRYMFLDSQGYYQGNCTRPLHYSYSKNDYFEKYSDYNVSSGRESRARDFSPVPPIPEPQPVREPTPVREPSPVVVEEILPVFSRTYDLEHHPIYHEVRTYPEYYDYSTRIVIGRSRTELEHVELQKYRHADYYNLADRVVLARAQELEHHPFEVREYPEYAPYNPYDEVYETQEVVTTFPAEENLIDLDDDESHYAEIEVALPYLPYTSCEEYVQYQPELPVLPPPPPPPLTPPPIPAERHYDEIYIGQDALDVSVTPTFGASTDQKNLGLEKSVHDRVREMEMEERMRHEETQRRHKEEKDARYRELQEQIRVAREEADAERAYDAYAEVTVERTVIPAPAKPRRVWVPPPKPEAHHDDKVDKPLGPVVFHELIYQQGILKKMYEIEHHQENARPVDRPVSRAQSRPTTPGLEPVKIDFPRLDRVEKDEKDIVVGHVVHKQIEKYQAYEEAQQARQAQEAHQHHHSHHSHHSSSQKHQEHHSHSQSQSSQIAHHEHHEHHNHHDHHQSHQNAHSHHVEKVVYDEPAITSVSEFSNTYNAYDNRNQDQNPYHASTVSQNSDFDYESAQAYHTIREMSKRNKWSVDEVPSPTSAKSGQITVGSSFSKSGVSSSSTTSHSHSSTSTVVHNVTSTHNHHHLSQSTTSLNRQNIPSPLQIAPDYEDSHHHEASHHEIHKSQSTSDLPQHSVGHVKNLAKLFNKPDEKPISTEQVIYRVRAAPPDHQIGQGAEPRPRSLRRIPLDEIELHEHGEDHLTKQHHEHDHQAHHESQSQSQSHSHSHTTSHTTSHHTESHQHHHTHGHSHSHHAQNENIENYTEINGNHHHKAKDHDYKLEIRDEPTIRVRRVYKAVADGNTATSMLSPISLNSNEFDEPLYDVPNDAT